MPNRSELQGSSPLPPLHMGEDEDGCGGCSGEDIISGLPDEVLHAILVRLGSARAAARTSVLSRRWRQVWAHMPEILLSSRVEARPPAPASFLDAVDSALAGCLVPALERLSIMLSSGNEIDAPAGRVVPWLRFAAERVTGDLRLFIEMYAAHDMPEEAELELPVCGGAKTITLFVYFDWRLRLQPEGLFKALTELVICGGKMEGSELTALVCTQCPRLRSLVLSGKLLASADVCILSDSLRSLSYNVDNTQRLEVVAPRLEGMYLCPSIDEVPILISAPKLVKLSWNGTYDPRYHRFSNVARHLLLLRFSRFSSVIWQFDEVDVLELFLFIPGVRRYQSLFDATKKMPKCKTLCVSLGWEPDVFASVILHLLRSFNSIRKFSLTLLQHGSWEHSCPSTCPCCSKDSHRIDNIDLGSLEEVEISLDVEISSSKISPGGFEFVELLSRCIATLLKRLVINYWAPATPETKEVYEKARSICRPNVEVEFYVFPYGGLDGRRVRLN